MERCRIRRGCLGPSAFRRLLLALGLGVACLTDVASAWAQEMCGGMSYPFPYADVSDVTAPFCPGIMEAYVTGISKGTSPTTFSPNDDVIRLQMTTFLQRTVDKVLSRESQRAALNQRWTPQNTQAMQTIALPSAYYCAADGDSIWTSAGNDVLQVQASTGKVVGTWTGATSSAGVLAAAGKVFAVGQASPGGLYVIDPTQPPGAVASVATLGNSPYGLAFDGTHIWSANFGGSVSIITPQSPYTVNTVTTGFNTPIGILFDGANIWVTDYSADTLLKLDAGGHIVQTVPVGLFPQIPVFDGANIWVPNGGDDSITVVQASTGKVVATISADSSNQLSLPTAASFDGERILVTNLVGNSVTVFKAADLSFIVNVTTGTSTGPYDACSDGINFWVTLLSTGNVLRF